MGEYVYEVMPYDADIHALAPPSTLIKYAVSASSRQAESEGITDKALYSKLGAVWMLARLRLTQTAAVRMGDKPVFSVDSHYRDGAALLRVMEISLRGICAARLDIAYIAVNTDSRRIIRPAEIERLWPEVPVKRGKTLRRLTAPSDMRQIGTVNIRYGDCDLNGHLNSAKYADIICENNGFWQDEPVLMTGLQIDYNSEILPGSGMGLYVAGSEPSYMRGETGGGICFTACYTTEPVI